MNGRLKEELLERFRQLALRALALAEVMEQRQAPRRVVDQLVGAGTSPGAQMYEAQEAISRKDFVRLLGLAAKELNELRYWVSIIRDRQWVAPDRLHDLLDESEQLRRIIRSMIVRTRRTGT